MKTEMTTVEREEFAVLLTKAYDDELSPDERATFQGYLDKYESCRREWSEFTDLKEVTKDMRLKSPPGETWDHYWEHIYNRLERGVAWILLSIGCIILLTYGGFKAIEALAADPQMETAIKVGLLFTIAGLAALLVSVLREKLSIRKTDPYKEIVR